MQYKRGRIYYADLSPVIGSEQGGLRPVVVISNDIGNRFSPIVIVAAMTSQIKRHYPTSVDLAPMDTGLKQESRICCEQLRTIDKKRLRECIGELTGEAMAQVDAAIKISLSL